MVDWDTLTRDEKVQALVDTFGMARQDAERQVAIAAGASPVDVVPGLPPAQPLVPK